MPATPSSTTASTTNEHVDAVNSAVQAHRLAAGQLGADHLEIGDTSLYVGDVVTTRRNQRLLRTTTGDSVRNPRRLDHQRDHP